MARVLIIEDDEASADLILRILVSEGHSIAIAENGALGVAKLAESPVDLVITDLLMPVLEGLETIRQIRRIDPSVKIIAVSGIQGSYLETATRFGANLIFRKPLYPSELRDAVAQLLSESGSSPSSPKAA